MALATHVKQVQVKTIKVSPCFTRGGPWQAHDDIDHGVWHSNYSHVHVFVYIRNMIYELVKYSKRDLYINESCL